MVADDTDRTLGRHDAEIAALQADMGELKADVKAILAAINETKGGWKTLVLLAGIAGAVGAVLAKISGFLTWLR